MPSSFAEISQTIHPRNINSTESYPTFAEPSTHYIIAFDLKVGGYREQLDSREILLRIDKLLTANEYNGHRDFISVIGWSLDLETPAIKDYARPYILNNVRVLWCKLGDKTLYDFLSDWPVGLPSISDHYYASMQSLSKPYSVMATMQSDKYSDRTIIILVTDERANGIDDNYVREWGEVSTYSYANTIKLNQIEEPVFGTLRQFNRNFYFEELFSQRTVIEGNYQIISYEVTASNKPSIYSATDLPSPLPFRRIRGGYKLQVNAEARDTNKYEIKEIAITNASGRFLYRGENGDLNNCFIESENLSDGDSLTVSALILFKDGLYNGTLLSPRNDNYRSGMSIPQIIRLNDDAKVFGLIPLTDTFWLWCHDNIVAAVLWWDIILLLIFIIAIGAILYRIFIGINDYKPDNKKLKIKKI